MRDLVVRAGGRVVGRQPNVGARRYYHTDLLGSTRAVVQGTTVVESYHADPWGLLLPGRTPGSGRTDWIGPEARDKLRAYGIAPPGRAEQGGLITLTRARQPVACPWCGSKETELRSEFGSTACKAIHVCGSCKQPFDEFKAI